MMNGTGMRKKGRRKAANPVSGRRRSEPGKERAPSGSPRPATPDAGDPRRGWAALIALGLLTAAVYFPATRAGFIWDDILVETIIRGALGLSGLWQIWFDPANPSLQKGTLGEAHYWPILYTTFWLEHRIWGFAPAGYHVVNILLHFANTALLWRLLLRLGVPGAWLAAALFAVHPVHTESVAWIIARKDLLSGLFYLWAVLAWLSFTENPGLRRYLAVVALFVAGALCKSIVVTLPAALLVCHWWKRGRVTRSDLLRLAPLFCVAIALAAADMSFYSSREPVSLDYSLAERALIAGRVLWFYVGKLLWPAGLAVIYPLWEISVSDAAAWAYLAAAAALPLSLWFLRRRIGRGPLAGVLFFGVTLFPVLGFFDYGYMQFSFVADRYQYLASIGVIAVLAGAAAHVSGGLSAAARKLLMGAAVAALVPLGAVTWKQSSIYRDNVSFYSHIISLNPQARGIHANLAGALIKEKRYEEALSATRAAIEQNRSSHELFHNAGLSLSKLGGPTEEVEEYYRKSLEIDPDYGKSIVNLADILRQRKKYREALELYRRAIGNDPGYATAHAGMGNLFFEMKRYGEAAQSLERAFSLRTDLPNAPHLRYILIQSQSKSGRGDGDTAGKHYETLAEHWEKALRDNPRSAEALKRLGEVRFSQKRFGEAAELFGKLAEMEPGNAAAHSNHGASLHSMGKIREALRSYERALSIDPGMEDALKNARIARKKLREETR